MEYLSTLSLMYSGWHFPIHIDKTSYKKNYASIENLKYLKYIYLLYIKIYIIHIIINISEVIYISDKTLVVIILILIHDTMHIIIDDAFQLGKKTLFLWLKWIKCLKYFKTFHKYYGFFYIYSIFFSKFFKIIIITELTLIEFFYMTITIIELSQNKLQQYLET